MDEAFKRRIRYRVEFPFPDEDDRALLWRRLLGDAPLAADLDAAELARRFRISGGHIKSAVLRAAFAAAAAGEPITQARLAHAANQELAAIGKLTRG
jgi:AAA+ superfamily predicted ATPase